MFVQCYGHYTNKMQLLSLHLGELQNTSYGRLPSTGLCFRSCEASQPWTTCLSICDLVTFNHQVIIHFVCYYAVMLIVWMGRYKFSHPSSNSHQFTYKEVKIKITNVAQRSMKWENKVPAAKKVSP